MRAGIYFSLRKFIKSPVFIFTLFLFSASSGAHAVTINFDDLSPAAYIDEEDYYRSLTNEYEALGLIFSDNAYLVGENNANFVSGPGFTMNFIGELPTYVGLFVLSTSPASFLSASGPGYLENKRTSGEVYGMGSEESTLLIPREYVSFTSATGIYAVSISGQAGNSIDDLTFYRAAAVSEPASITLFGFGLLLLVWRRYFKKYTF